MAKLELEPKKFENRTFRDLRDADVAAALTEATLVRCTIERCTYGATAKSPPERRSIRNVSLRDCRVSGNCSVGPIVVDEVDIEHCISEGLFIARGAVYRHVRLRGRFGRMLLSFLPTLVYSDTEIEAFRRADRAFYEKVDWALDISAIECDELDIRNVPARLIRRDPRSQVVVNYEKVSALRSVWEGLELSGTPWQTALRNVLQWKLEDMVLVAPKGLDSYERLVDGLRLLQAAGVAEPD